MPQKGLRLTYAAVLLVLLLGSALNTAEAGSRQRRRNKKKLGAQGGTVGAPPPDGGAYVFVASLGDTDGHYWDLVLAGLQCMQSTNPSYGVGIIWDGEQSEKVATAFAALNVSVFQYPDYFVEKGVDLEVLDRTTRPAIEQNWYWKKAWNKLLVWTLTQYSKVVALDPDIIAWGNSDAMFQWPELSAAPDYYFQTQGEDHYDAFNGGVIVTEPSMATYQALISQLENGDTEWFQEQGLLNNYYKHRYHLLPFAYNMWPSIIASGGMTGRNQSVNIVKLVHHVSESACGECDLGWKTEETCQQHVCPECCMRVVTCREQAHERIQQYQQEQQQQQQGSEQQAGDES